MNSKTPSDPRRFLFLAQSLGRPLFGSQISKIQSESTMMNTKTVVEAKGLTKKYEDRTVVNGVQFEVYQGECFGILGPNGAGKTTMMKMMYGMNLITAGDLYVLGLNIKQSPRQVKSRIGVIPQEDGLDTDFTVLENLLLYASFHGLDKVVATHRAEDLLRVMRLDEYASKPVETLSGGMRRRLAIARGMINQPELLFLDEPTSGLDPQARIWIWNFLHKIKEDMGTVVMTTHYMEEAEQICDRVAIMDKGRILAIGKPKDLVNEFIGAQVVEFDVKDSDLNYYLNRLSTNGFQYQVIRNQVNVHLTEEQQAKDVLNIVSGRKVTMRVPTLSDVFLKLAGHDLRDEPL